MRKSLLSAVLLAFTLSACEDPTGRAGSGNVAVRFATAPTSANGVSYSVSGSEQLVVTGSNGTLTITDVRLILNEFKLERLEAECDGLEGEAEDACEKFEAPPAFLDLPLGPGAVVAATQEVPAGQYTELKFEAEDIDFDEEDDDKSAAIQALAQTVKAAFPDWPSDASMVVVGTFTPTDGEPVPFTTYFEAEVKVEQEFESALVIDDANRAVTVEVDPSGWFLGLDGSVFDLSAYDFATTGEVVEFEAKMENGFTKIELDD